MRIWSATAHIYDCNEQYAVYYGFRGLAVSNDDAEADYALPAWWDVIGLEDCPSQAKGASLLRSAA